MRIVTFPNQEKKEWGEVKCLPLILGRGEGGRAGAAGASPKGGLQAADHGCLRCPRPMLLASDSQRAEDHGSVASGHWALERRDTEKLEED